MEIGRPGIAGPSCERRRRPEGLRYPIYFAAGGAVFESVSNVIMKPLVSRVS